MQEFRQKSLLRKIFFSRPVFLLFLVLAGLVVVPVWNVYQKSRRAVSRNEAVVEKIKGLEERRNDLWASMSELSGESGVEKELRKKFQIKKPGEEYVVIVDSSATATEPDGTEQSSFKESFFTKLLNLLKF